MCVIVLLWIKSYNRRIVQYREAKVIFYKGSRNGLIVKSPTLRTDPFLWPKSMSVPGYSDFIELVLVLICIDIYYLEYKGCNRVIIIFYRCQECNMSVSCHHHVGVILALPIFKKWCILFILVFRLLFLSIKKAYSVNSE